MPDGRLAGAATASAAPVLVLASASPRRLALLRQIGFEPACRPSHIDESPHTGEATADLVNRLATLKARAALPLAGEVALGADTVIEQDGRVLGKPAGRADLLDMFERLSGREHRVLSGVALAIPEPDGNVAVHAFVVVTVVRFATVGPEEAAAYWATGEPSDKAGGYAIQGGGARFVEALNGSYSNVVGLPLFETARLLERAGVVANRSA